MFPVKHNHSYECTILPYNHIPLLTSLCRGAFTLSTSSWPGDSDAVAGIRPRVINGHAPIPRRVAACYWFLVVLPQHVPLPRHCELDTLPGAGPGDVELQAGGGGAGGGAGGGDGSGRWG